MRTSFVCGLAVMFVLNAIALTFIAARSENDANFEKITVREFELAGSDGVRRVNIKVESGGEVIFRMMDKKGTIRVKLGANEDGSALVLLNEDTEPGIHALSKASGKLIVTDGNGKKREL